MSNVTDKDVFIKTFSQLTGINVASADEAWATKVYDVATKYINTGIQADNTLLYDLVLSDKEAPIEYKNRFSVITELKKQNSNLQLSVADYIKQERQYKTLLTESGLGSLANNDSIKKFFLNGISYDVAATRINKAYSAIDTADEYTKSILSERFPGLTKADVAASLLTGSEGTAEIEKKIYGAQLLGAAKSAGIKTTLSEEQLMSSELTSAEAKKAFQGVAEQQVGIQQAAQTFGDTLSRQQLQASLEKEALGIGSDETKKKIEGLASQARAQFAGGTGVVQGSLSKQRSGQL